MQSAIINPPQVVKVRDYQTWDEWLSKVELALKELGYTKYQQNLKNEDFAYWKTIRVNGEKAYQVGLLFYDFRKFDNFRGSNRIGVQFECMPINTDSRVDLSVSKDITVQQFEEMAAAFYNTMLLYF